MILFAVTGYFYAQTARVQVIHNSADAAAEFVDVYLNEDLLIPDFGFRTASPFIDAPAGVEIILSVAPAGSTSVGDAIYSAEVTLTADETYVVVADGIVSASGYNPAPAFGLQITGGGREIATDPANTDVLVHHGSTDAPTVQVVETGAGAGVLIDNISYTEFAGYLELPTADYVLEVRTADGITTVASYQAPLAALSLEGAALVVIASGFLDPSQNSDGASFGLWVSLPSGGDLIPLPAATLGVSDFNENTFVMFPNPANNQLNFDFKSLDVDELTISITDIQGRVILNNRINSTNSAIDVSSLSTGLYQVTILDGNSILSTKKLLKK